MVVASILRHGSYERMRGSLEESSNRDYIGF